MHYILIQCALWKVTSTQTWPEENLPAPIPYINVTIVFFLGAFSFYAIRNSLFLSQNIFPLWINIKQQQTPKYRAIVKPFTLFVYNVENKSGVS